MRILIDECLNWRLSRALTGHYAVSAQKMGWSGIKNGKLLALAVENGFDVFLTGDRNLTFQQNLTEFSIVVMILEADGTRGAMNRPETALAWCQKHGASLVFFNPTNVAGN